MIVEPSLQIDQEGIDFLLDDRAPDYVTNICHAFTSSTVAIVISRHRTSVSAAECDNQNLICRLHR
ncbi:hypothetical protein WJ42_20935 [Burkholderia cepacia]|nr:hypothetical protein WJ42_20935 [Burkholderia cepacia]